MDKIIATLPIKPQSKTNLGMRIAPILTEFYFDVLGVDKLVWINTLNTYNDKDNEYYVYEKDIKSDGVDSPIWRDSDFATLSSIYIQDMVDTGIIKKSSETIIRCNCGKVDMLIEGLRSFSDGNLYERRGEKIYCKNCGSECKEYKEDVLKLDFDSRVFEEMSLCPTFLKKEVNMLATSFNGSKMLVSKDRDTGYYIYHKGKRYNIDIDFIWMNLPKLMDHDDIILTAGNRQVSKMFLMDYINRISSPEKKLTFLAHPYLEKNDNLSKYTEVYLRAKNNTLKRLLLLLNLRWNVKTCDLSKSTLTYLTTISSTRIEYIYKAMIELARKQTDKPLNFDEMLYKLSVEGMNMQRAISLSKKLYKECNSTN